MSHTDDTDYEPTWITVQFIAATTTRTAYYLRRPSGPEVYAQTVVGVVIGHEFSGAPHPTDSETRLAYLDGVAITGLDDGPQLVGVYLGSELPPEADVKAAQATWTCYLKNIELEAALAVKLRETDATYRELVKAEPDAAKRVEIKAERDTHFAALKQDHRRQVNAIRAESRTAS